MPKLNLMTCFHGNLDYSSIPESKHREVLNKCYWPIISLVEDYGIKLGIEFPAKTLEIIDRLNHSLIEELKRLIEAGRIEFIGSGYTQAIFPLIPARVNLENLRLGDSVYRNLLGIKPEIALVNEQVYSKGLNRLYKEAGYKAIIIDWVNSLKSNPQLQESKFFATKAKGTDGEDISVIWNNSVLFQKLQRYVYGDVTLDEYIDFVKSHYSEIEDRVLMVYGSDIEVFDFRPRIPELLQSGKITEPEIKKITQAFSRLNAFDEIEFILPSKALDINYNDKVYEIGSPEYPIITKKQEKYNEIRWAVCGKNNYITNSRCYKAYKLLLEYEKEYGRQEDKWRRLIEFWDSDYRTHIEKKRWRRFRRQLDGFIEELRRRLKEKTVPRDKFIKKIQIEDDIIETDYVLLRLSDKKGATIKELVFKNVSDKPLVRTTPQGYYDNISYAVDLFSGHTIILNEGRQMTDLSKAEIRTAEMKEKIRLSCQNNIEGIGKVTKDYYIYKNLSKVELLITLEFLKRIKPSFVRCGIITINPEAFDKGCLYYSTRNGGFDKELYHIKKSFDHAASIDMRISTRHCLGTTDEELEIGDKDIALIIRTDKSQTYSVPLIKFEDLKESFVLRIFNSIIEQDETSETFIAGRVKILFSYEAYKK